jgi:hypothetical protein
MNPRITQRISSITIAGSVEYTPDSHLTVLLFLKIKCIKRSAVIKRAPINTFTG